MRVIPYRVYDGAENMRIDEELFDEAITSSCKEPVLRLYGWKRPTLTIGRNQSCDGIDEEFCREKNIQIIRRITGGRAVLHDSELTYCFVVPVDFLRDGSCVIKSYREISEALVLGFSEMGVEVSFIDNKKVSVKNPYCMAISSGADLSVCGRKFIGSAQCRKRGYILQHGSIVFDIDSSLVSGIFGEDEGKESVITLMEINQNLASDIDFVCRNVISGFEKKFGTYV